MSAGTLGGLINILGGLLRPRAKAKASAGAEVTTGGGGDDDPGGPIVWETVVFASGSIEASLIAGRLQSEGIPARIRQEAAGAAYGLTVGLGSIRVMVPEERLSEALALLEETVEVNLADFDDIEDDEDWPD